MTRTNLFLLKAYEKPLHYCTGFYTDTNFSKCIGEWEDNSRKKRTMAIKAVIVQAVPIDVKTDNAS
jgi:hypothetical protein